MCVCGESITVDALCHMGDHCETPPSHCTYTCTQIHAQAAEELNAAVFVHPWDMELGGRMKKYWLPWLVGESATSLAPWIRCKASYPVPPGMPGETAVAICSMIMGGVLERFPRLKVCFAHGGGAFPYIIGRVEHGFNVRPDLCATENPFNPR